MSKTILIVSDALRDDVAAAQMGYLEHLIEHKRGNRYTVVSEMPTLSRPLYETIQSGMPPLQHGILSNQTVRVSSVPNLFQLARRYGRTTAATAYCWVSELYVHAPYDRLLDGELDDESTLIQHGRFYTEDDFPDAELFTQAARLLLRHQPDYMLIHPMGMDYIGEHYGANSPQYRKQAAHQDQIMAMMLPTVLEAGYVVLVTGDHGMNDDAFHNGTGPDVRHVPLYILGAGFEGNTGQRVSQLQIAPTICALLDIPAPETMKAPALITSVSAH